MFRPMFLLLLIFGWFSVDCLVPVPPVYRRAEFALKRFMSNPSYNPITYSLLNVLIHDKQARAFISDQAITMALEQVKEFDQQTKTNNEKLLRQAIYGINCKRNRSNCLPFNRQKINRTSQDFKQRIVLELDKFFSIPNIDDDVPNTTDNGKKN